MKLCATLLCVLVFSAAFIAGLFFFQMCLVSASFNILTANEDVLEDNDDGGWAPYAGGNDGVAYAKDVVMENTLRADRNATWNQTGTGGELFLLIYVVFV